MNNQRWIEPSTEFIQQPGCSVYCCKYIDEKSTSTVVHSVDIYGDCIDPCKRKARLAHPHSLAPNRL